MTGTDAEFETLLRDALGRPGVSEHMEVYSQYVEIARRVDSYLRALALCFLVWTSDHTEEVA